MDLDPKLILSTSSLIWPQYEWSNIPFMAGLLHFCLFSTAQNIMKWPTVLEGGWG